MDQKQFDALARAVGDRWTRRGALRWLGGAFTIAAAGALGESAGAKKKPHKPKKPKSGCTVRPGDRGSTILVNGSATYKGKPLKFQSTTPPFDANNNSSGVFSASLGGSPVLKIETHADGPVVTVTTTYGNAFGGINKSTFTNDGTTITGNIDGRAIVPMAPSADPAKAKFQDGNPPPTVHVDAALAKAIQSGVKKTGKQARRCGRANHATSDDQGGEDEANRHSHQERAGRNGKHRAGSGASRSARADDPHLPHRADPSRMPDCTDLYASCGANYTLCAMGVAAACAPALFGYGICYAAAIGGCVTAAERCRRGFRDTYRCCPRICGGDSVDTLFGADAACCPVGDACADPNSNTSLCCPENRYGCHGKSCCLYNTESCSPDGKCCPRGQTTCNGVCCSDGHCINGFCCEGQNGSLCNGRCCGPFDSCCGGRCCTGTCNGSTCCVNGTSNCGSGCCPTNRVCCNGVCCNSGATCVNNQCKQTCRAGENPCGPLCCSGSTPDCCPWGCGANACTR